MRCVMRGTWGVGLLLAAGPWVVGCGDSLSAPGAEVVSRDLEFVLPAVKGDAGVVAQDLGDGREGGLGALRGTFADSRSGEPRDGEPRTGGEPTGGDTGSGEQALIFSKFATSHFDGDTYNFEYGVFGFGTGYTMSPSFTISHADGTTILSEHGRGRSEDAWQVPLFLRPTAKESVRIAQTCGAFANLHVDFLVRLDNTIYHDIHTRANASERSSTSQPKCQAMQTGGGGTSEPGTKYQICYYEVWVDLDGNVVAVHFLGCYALPTNMV